MQGLARDDTSVADEHVQHLTVHVSEDELFPLATVFWAVSRPLPQTAPGMGTLRSAGAVMAAR